MEEDVKRVRGQRQVARTEARILAAATELFLRQGYVATTVEGIAAAADVGARTVYVRFSSKAVLFKRVVDVAIVGDTAPVDVRGRDWMRPAFAAPTRAERVAALAAAGRQILERTGPLFAVAQQAAAVEPLIAGYWQEGRVQTHRNQRAVWAQMAGDGLLEPGTDLDWLVDTASVVCSPETYLLIAHMHGWGIDTYERWLVDTLTVLAAQGELGSSGAK